MPSYPLLLLFFILPMIFIISASSAGFKKMLSVIALPKYESAGLIPFVLILFAKFGPTLAKYLLKALAMFALPSIILSFCMNFSGKFICVFFLFNLALIFFQVNLT